MKILVTGINGLVGNALDRLLSETNHNTLNTSRTLDGIAQEKLDITSVSEIDKIFDDFKPDAVINSAAMADVDLCEDEKEQCWDVNVNGIKNLIRACKMYDSHLVHISTDYIFDGTKEGDYTLKKIPQILRAIMPKASWRVKTLSWQVILATLSSERFSSMESIKIITS